MTSPVTYSDHEVQVNGLRLHYQEWGEPSSPAVLMLHGFGVSGHMFDEFAARASDSYHLIALDQRGHGDSDWSEPGDYSRAAFISDVEGFVKELGLERFVLMGHSMGGLNSAAYTAEYAHRVKALVLVDVGPEAAKEGVDNIMRFTRGPDELDFEEFVEMAHRFNQRRTIENIRERMRHRLRQLENGKWTWKFDSRFRKPENDLRVGSELTNDDTWKLFRSIAAPTLLVRGGESDVLTQDVADRCVREMHRARLVTVPGAGHSVPGDNPDAFSEAVLTFITDVDGGKFEPMVVADPPPLSQLVTAQERAARRRPGSKTLLLVAAGAIAAIVGALILTQARAKAKKPLPADSLPPATPRRSAEHVVADIGKAGRRGSKRARQMVQDLDARHAADAAMEAVQPAAAQAMRMGRGGAGRARQLAHDAHPRQALVAVVEAAQPVAAPAARAAKAARRAAPKLAKRSRTRRAARFVTGLALGPLAPGRKKQSFARRLFLPW